MALLTAAIANGGIMPEPFMVSRTIGAFDNTVSSHSPRRIGRVMSAEVAEILADMMVDVVNYGTGAPAALANVQVAGKTGTAQNETGIDHSWFIGFAGGYALAIIMENTGGGTRATGLAGQIFELIIDN
jgi:peptidoglycan glycosyltransferase